MLGDTIDNISKLLMIDLTIIPNIITFIVLLVIIYLSFKMQVNGFSGLGFVVILYTASMGVLTLLGINGIFNIFSLIGDLL